MTVEDMQNMRLHEVVRVRTFTGTERKDDIDVLRVHNGWIYVIDEKLVFVPGTRPEPA